MPTNYLSVRTALYDSVPGQGDVNGQLKVKANQILLLLNDTSDTNWWKFKIKTDRHHNSGDCGLVPKMQTQEAKFISSATACRDFIARIDGDLTIYEEETLSVYCDDGDWILVKSSRGAGYVPKKCVELGQGFSQSSDIVKTQATESMELESEKLETLNVSDRERQWDDEIVDLSAINDMAPRTDIDAELKNNSESGSTTVLDEIGARQSNTITRRTTMSEVVSLLASHGCQDITNRLDLSSFGEHPISQSDTDASYQGVLLDGTRIAVKTIRLYLDDFSQSSTLLKRAARELYVWSKCQHPNVMPLFGLVCFRDQIGMVSPRMPYGGLPRYLERVTEADRLDMCVQICEGLSYLHKNGIIHGNLKAANVFVSDEGVPILTGFATSSIMDNNSLQFTQTTSSASLTVRWTAPEILAETHSQTNASDIYALGMTFYETITGMIPYSGKRDYQVLYLVLVKKEYPKRPETMLNDTGTADGLWKVCTACWSFEPEARPTVDKVADTLKMIQYTSALSRNMAVQAVVSHLVSHGCDDLSDRLNLTSFGDYPVAQGGFSDIYRGQLWDRTAVAVKVLRVSLDNINQGSKHRKRAARELHTWNKCTSHPNIVPLLGLAVFRSRIGMVTPWFRNGCLPKYLKVFPRVDRYNICVQICGGLSYLHRKQIVHCDLKGANVLVSDEGIPLLTDFGTSLVSDRTMRFTGMTSGPSYTLRWSANEILQEGSHTKASDVYALGMTIYETMAGEVPYNGRNDAGVIRLVTLEKKHPERPECISIGNMRTDKLWELLCRCWSYEPEARPTADEVTETMREITEITTVTDPST